MTLSPQSFKTREEQEVFDLLTKDPDRAVRTFIKCRDLLEDASRRVEELETANPPDPGVEFSFQAVQELLQEERQRGYLEGWDAGAEETRAERNAALDQLALAWDVSRDIARERLLRRMKKAS